MASYSKDSQYMPKSRLRILSLWTVFFAVGYIGISQLEPLLPTDLVLILKTAFGGLSVMFALQVVNQMWLWKEMAEWNRTVFIDALNTSNNLLKVAGNSGLSLIYESREDAISDIHKDLENASIRVQYLGITMSRVLNNSDLLEKTKEVRDKNKRFDFRILLLDPLRSPAIFRGLIESPTKRAAEKYVKLPEDDFHEYFQSHMYTSSFSTSESIQTQLRKEIHGIVRFYAHAPSCWAVIIDNVVYFEPYTLGAPEIFSKCSSPVYRYEYTDESSFFNLIVEHFQKLWITSDVDAFHMKNRRSIRKELLYKVLGDRNEWFRHVYETIHCSDEPSSKMDRRKCPRQHCMHAFDSLSIKLEGTDEGDPSIPIQVKDYSRNSIRIESDHSFCGGESVSLLFGKDSSDPELARQAIDQLRNLSSNDFKVELFEDGERIVLMSI